MTKQPISVIIIEDEKEVRLGLSYIIENTDGFTCLDSFKSYEEALQSVTKPPDVLLSDIGLPGMSGIEGAKLFKRQFPSTLIIMLTVYSDDEKIFQSICAGASGYILKKAEPARIVEAIREVCEGGAPMSSEIALRVVNAFRTLAPKKHGDSGLTHREEEILDELVKGNSYKSTADHLNISIHTVRFHIRSIYEKLQVHSKSEAVAKALKQNLLP
ncbi:MAG: response regulator transcription factor [Ignavibacteria bacterium]|nr:MAG: response regulator transcription factor [Ignavibacteria bacterium]